VSQLRQSANEFAEAGVQVAIVTFDADFMATAYVKQTGLQWPLLIDHERKLYRAWHFDRATWWDIYGPVSVWNYLKLIARGRKIAKPGEDWLQLGGNVLIDPKGIVRMHHRSKTPHDRPGVQEILSVVKSQTQNSPDHQSNTN
jgi:alkyl hydroperoxide reductase subunit AhpC